MRELLICPSVFDSGGDHGQPDRPLLAPTRQCLDVAATAMAEGKIRTAAEMPRLDAAADDLIEELISRQGGKGCIEPDLIDNANATLGEQRGPLIRSGEPEGRIIGAKKLHADAAQR